MGCSALSIRIGRRSVKSSRKKASKYFSLEIETMTGDSQI